MWWGRLWQACSVSPIHEYMILRVLGRAATFVRGKSVFFPREGEDAATRNYMVVILVFKRAQHPLVALSCACTCVLRE